MLWATQTHHLEQQQHSHIQLTNRPDPGMQFAAKFTNEFTVKSHRQIIVDPALNDFHSLWPDHLTTVAHEANSSHANSNAALPMPVAYHSNQSHRRGHSTVVNEANSSHHTRTAAQH